MELAKSTPIKLKNSDLLPQAALSFIVRIAGAFSAFILSMVIGRQLGAEESGYYFLAFSIVTFGAGFSRVGLDNTILRFTGSAFADCDRGAIKAVLKKSLSIASTVSAMLALLLYFLSDILSVHLFFKPLLAPVLKAMAAGTVGLALFTLAAMSLQGIRRIPASVFTLNISVNLLLIVALLLFVIDSSVELAGAYSIASLITLVLGLMIWKRGLNSLSEQCEQPHTINWKLLFDSCLPLWVVMLMQQLTQWSGQFIAGAWVPSEDVAQLAVAQRTATLTSFILMAVNMVVAPRFAAMYKQGKLGEIRKLALTSVRLMVMFALPIIGVMLLFPGFLMGLFGEGFSSGAHLLQILAIGQFVNVATGSVGFLLSMSGHEKDLRNTTLISGPIAVGSALLLVPMYGATGSAIATALAIASQNLIAVFWVKKRLGFNTLAIWEKI